jgi:preprotein translocase subunit SecG
MQTVILIVHLLVAVGLIGLVLLQQGKGADMGAAFGSGASSTFFGARGSASALTRATAILAGLFFVTSIALAALSGGTRAPTSVLEQPAAAEQPQGDTPAAPAQAPAVPDVPVAPKK